MLYNDGWKWNITEFVLYKVRGSMTFKWEHVRDDANESEGKTSIVTLFRNSLYSEA